MTSTDAPIDFSPTLKRLLTRAFWVCCGIGLFVIAGIVGGLIILYWVI